MEEAERLKQEGNLLFSNKDYLKALVSYGGAISQLTSNKLESIKTKRDELLSILHSNSGACHLELGNFAECIAETTKSLQLNSQFTKSLWRRSQANQKLTNWTDAVQDLQALLRIDPKNKAAVADLQRIHQDMKNSTLSVSNVHGLLQALSDGNQEKHEEALSKLVEASRDRANATLLASTPNGIQTIATLLNKGTPTFTINALKILNIISLLSEETPLKIFEIVGQERLEKFIKIDENSSVIIHTLPIITNIFNVLSPKTTPDPEELSKIKKRVIDSLIVLLHHKEENVQAATLRELARISWNREDISPLIQDHLGDLLYPSFIGELRFLVSMVITRLLPFNYEKTILLFKTTYLDYFEKWLDSEDPKNHLLALSSLSAFFMADLEAATDIFIKKIQPIIERIDALLSTKEYMEKTQLLAAELLSHASSHKSFQKLCDPELLDELIILLKSDNPEMQARILSLTSKLATGNEKIATRVLENGEESVRHIMTTLSDTKAKKSVIQWSIEALCFLTLQPTLREYIVNDTKSLQCLYNIGKLGDPTIIYGLSSVFYNLSKYMPRDDDIDKLKSQLSNFANGNPQMKKLAPHELELDDQVSVRCKKLVDSGITSILYGMTRDSIKSASSITLNAKIALTDVFLSVTTTPKNRGRVVADGGMKALLLLYNEGKDDPVSSKAAHALAKIAISVDPNLGFKDTATDLIRPFMDLLRSEDGLQQFEALLALTNLSLVGDETMTAILRDGGLGKIETCQLSHHPMIQRAATELLCNMTMYEEVVEKYTEEESGERRLKIAGGLSQCDDPQTCVAAAGTLAILSGHPEILARIREVLGIELFLNLSCSEDESVQHRGIEVLKNMILMDEEVAEKISNTEGENLLAKIKDSSKNPAIVEALTKCLEKIRSYK